MREDNRFAVMIDDFKAQTVGRGFSGLAQSDMIGRDPERRKRRILLCRVAYGFLNILTLRDERSTHMHIS